MSPEEIIAFLAAVDDGLTQRRAVKQPEVARQEVSLDFVNQIFEAAAVWRAELDGLATELIESPLETRLTAIGELRKRFNDEEVGAGYESVVASIFENLTLGAQCERMAFLECCVGFEGFRKSSSIQGFLERSSAVSRFDDDEFRVLRRLCERASSIFAGAWTNAAGVRRTVADFFTGASNANFTRLNHCDPWAELADTEIGQMANEERAHWKELIDYCRSASQSKPTVKWLKVAAALIQPIGHTEFATRVARWLREVRPSFASHVVKPSYSGHPCITPLSDANCD